MRWYLNDASLQGQFGDPARFEVALRGMLGARVRVPSIKAGLYSARSLRDAQVSPGSTVRQFLQQCRDKDLRAATYNWLDRAGPFVDDDRLPEQDDYFECHGMEITDTGLGEAVRRVKAGENCACFSFEGGATNFASDPLLVDHGLEEERYGRYVIRNLWTKNALVEHALSQEPAATSWRGVVEAARLRFEHLEIGALHENKDLAREPFEASVRDQSLRLMGILNDYVAGRLPNGSEGTAARAIIGAHFTGDRALFTGESEKNESKFRQEMTFGAPDGVQRFAPWHGKISHRFFRVHFEWPLHPQRRKLAILYLGPKITRG